MSPGSESVLSAMGEARGPAHPGRRGTTRRPRAGNRPPRPPASSLFPKGSPHPHPGPGPGLTSLGQLLKCEDLKGSLGRPVPFPHFTDVEVEAESGKGLCPRSRDQPGSSLPSETGRSRGKHPRSLEGEASPAHGSAEMMRAEPRSRWPALPRQSPGRPARAQPSARRQHTARPRALHTPSPWHRAQHTAGAQRRLRNEPVGQAKDAPAHAHSSPRGRPLASRPLGSTDSSCSRTASPCASGSPSAQWDSNPGSQGHGKNGDEACEHALACCHRPCPSSQQTPSS